MQIRWLKITAVNAHSGSPHQEDGCAFYPFDSGCVLSDGAVVTEITHITCTCFLPAQGAHVSEGLRAVVVPVLTTGAWLRGPGLQIAPHHFRFSCHVDSDQFRPPLRGSHEKLLVFRDFGDLGLGAWTSAAVLLPYIFDEWKNLRRNTSQ